MKTVIAIYLYHTDGWQRYSPSRRSGLTLLEMTAVLSVITILGGLILPAIQAARAASRRSACANNCKQVSLAIHNFESAFKQLPVGTHQVNSNTPYRSWFSQLLPFVGQSQTFNETELAYTKSRNPFSPIHSNLKTHLPVFMCVEDARLYDTTVSARFGFVVGLSSFQGNSGTNSSKKDGVFIAETAIRFKDINDGISSTLAFGERPPSTGFDYGWWYAGAGSGDGTLDHILGTREIAMSAFAACNNDYRRFRPGKIDDECSSVHYWSLHAGGAHFGFLDGSVRFLPYDADGILVQLATRNGHEIITVPD